MTDTFRARPLPRRRFVAGAALGLAAAAAFRAAPAAAQAVGPADRLIVPGTRVGLIRKQSTVAAIQRAYGVANVRRARIDVGEGETEPGALVFPGKPDQIAVVLTSTGTVQYVRMSREAGAWRTESGIRVGLPLAELVRLNGGHFKFSGFGWDGSGMLNDESAAKLPKALRIRLYPRKDAELTEAERQQITGDISVMTDNPVLEKLDIAIATIEAHFE